MAEKKPPFEGKLIYTATDGRWIAGVPSRDITAEEWVEAGYSDRANFTPEDLVATGLYELKPPRAKPGQSKAGTDDTTTPAPAPTADSSPESSTGTGTGTGTSDKDNTNTKE